jgi:hypothetical protein
MAGLRPTAGGQATFANARREEILDPMLEQDSQPDWPDERLRRRASH